MADADVERGRRDWGWRDGRGEYGEYGAAGRPGAGGRGGEAEAERLGREQQRRATAYGRARGQL